MRLCLLDLLQVVLPGFSGFLQDEVSTSVQNLEQNFLLLGWQVFDGGRFANFDPADDVEALVLVIEDWIMNVPEPMGFRFPCSHLEFFRLSAFFALHSTTRPHTRHHAVGSHELVQVGLFRDKQANTKSSCPAGP